MPANAAKDDNAVTLTDLQQRVMNVPEEHDLALTGGRGGGKSHTLAMLALRYCEQYKEHARVLYVRRSHTSLADFKTQCILLFGAVYGRTVRFNAHAGTFTFPNGATLELNQLEDANDFLKYQGRSFGLLIVDEAGQFGTPEWIDRLRSNLRAPHGVPVRMVISANPGGPGHAWVRQRYIAKSQPWKPFHEEKSGKEWVCCPSTYLDNPHIDQQGYRRELEASCAGDPELLKAWLEGDWSIARGAFFSDCISESRNLIEPWEAIPFGWQRYLAYDHGSAAPGVCFVCAVSPGATVKDRYFARDSIVLVDELSSHVPDDVTTGLRWNVQAWADGMTELMVRWNVSSRGDNVADDAMFAGHGHGAGSIAAEFSRYGVHFRPARKGSRVGGWTRMRDMLASAGEVDKPGLYASRLCEGFWLTVPTVPRDPRRVEDVDSRSPDHWADAARYALLRPEAATLCTKRLRGG